MPQEHYNVIKLQFAAIYFEQMLQICSELEFSAGDVNASVDSDADGDEDVEMLP